MGEVGVSKDVVYGEAAEGRPLKLDVYRPSQPNGAAVIAVHGGGWRMGSKEMLVEHAKHLARDGFVVVAPEYRLTPETCWPAQIHDVKRAIRWTRAQAGSLGFDADKLCLQGHSAGAHLVALLGARPSALTEAGARRPRAVVALDSAAMNVEQVMQARHLPLYDRAFGEDPTAWVAVSPWHALSPASLPMLLVCSSQRQDSCTQARGLARRAQDLRVPAQVLPEDLSHMQINRELGAPSDYTSAVDRFIAEAVR